MLRDFPPCRRKFSREYAVSHAQNRATGFHWAVAGHPPDPREISAMRPPHQGVPPKSSARWRNRVGDVPVISLRGRQVAALRIVPTRWSSNLTGVGAQTSPGSGPRSSCNSHRLLQRNPSNADPPRQPSSHRLRPRFPIGAFLLFTTLFRQCARKRYRLPRRTVKLKS